MRLAIAIGLAVLTSAPLAAQGAAAPDLDAEAVRCLAEAGLTPESIDLTPEQQKSSLACGFASAARQINATAPVRVDQLTTVESVTADGALLTYHARVDVDAADVSAEQVQALVANTRSYVCSAPEMLQTVQMGGSFAYRWNDRAGRRIGDVRIDRC